MDDRTYDDEHDGSVLRVGTCRGATNGRRTMKAAKKREQRMVRLPPDLYDALKERAKAHDLTVAQAARRAVRAYIVVLDAA